jgi:Ricin-type beta-trefoil lectin domain
MSDRDTAPERSAVAAIRYASVLPRVTTPPGTGAFSPEAVRSPHPSAGRPAPAVTVLGTHRPESRLVLVKVAVAVLVAMPFAVTLVSSRGIYVRDTSGGRPNAERPGATASPPSRSPSPAPSATAGARSPRPRPSSSGAMNVRSPSKRATPVKPPKPPKRSTAPAGPPAAQGSVSAPTRMLMSLASGRCIDVTGGEPDDGTPLQIRDCTGGARQLWTFERDGTVRSMGLCMDAAWGSSDDGTVIQLVRCHGGPAQHFALYGDGELVNLGSGKCVDVVDMETANGTRLQLWECAGTSNQRWSAV